MPDTEQTLEITVECPNSQCKKKKGITVPEYLFSNKKTGTLKVQIHAGICCEHEFIAFVSKKGKVVGYEAIDMSIDLSSIEKSEVQGKVFLRDLLKKYGDYALSSCIHSILLNIPIIFLRKKTEKSLTSEISHLFNSFLPDRYNQNLIHVSTIWDVDYRKATITDSLVISPEGLIANAPWANISLDFETQLLSDALSILDDGSQYLVIQQQFEKLFDQAAFITEEIFEHEIFEEDLKKKIKERFKFTPTDNHLKLLKQIVSFRFKGDIKKIKIRSFSKLKEGLW